MGRKTPGCKLSSSAVSSSAGVPAAHLAYTKSRKTPRCKWPWMAAVVFSLVAGLSVFTSGQQGRLAGPRDSLHVPILTFGPQGPAELEGLADGWSHHHLIFSNPGTEEDAVRDGRYEEWLKTVNNPRYIMQQLKRRAPAQGPAAEYVARMNELARAQEAAEGDEFASPPFEDSVRPIGPIPVRLPKLPIHRDWSMDLGSGAKVGAGVFPAKYSFNGGAANCGNASQPDYVVYNTGLTGTPGTDASQTGTFAGSSGTGTVVVDSVTLTASAGTAASQTTTISTNGVASGNTIKITNPLGSLSLTLTASTPVAQEDQLAVSSTEPSPGDYLTIQGIVYEFENSYWTNRNVPSGSCYINRAAGQTSIVSYLAAAISFNGRANGTNTTWYCNNNATQPSNGVTVTSSTSPDVDVTAKIAGSTGFTTSTSGSYPPAVTVLITGSDGSSTSPNFQWWSGAAAVSNTKLATNIYTAITTGSAAGVTATNPSGEVVITASLTGLAGNSINVTTTISSGLAGAKFNGNLTGGAAGTTSGTTFSTSTDSTTQSTNLDNEATALATAINANVPAVSATPSGAGVTVTDKTAGIAGNSIGTTGTLGGTFSWAGSTLAGGVDPQPTVVAYDNLYSSCSGYGSGPNVYWQYNTAYPQGSTTGDGSTATTSVVLSGDGTQVAFVQNNSSNVASLVLLKWASGASEVQMDTSSNNVTATSYPTCTAPCMTRITFSGSPSDTNSSPFYDYPDDIIYVGDNSGKLHKFTGVFTGTPAEVTTSGWPITVSSNILTSPVYDSGTSKDIFVADSGGFLYSYTAAGSAVMKSSQLARSGSKGIVDGPLVDSTTEFVYVFVGDDESTNTSGSFNCNNSTGCNGVFQFPASDSTIGAGVCTASSATSWGSATNCGKEAVFGNGNTGTVLYDGSFDQVYYSGTGTSGNLWTCAYTGTPAPKLNYVAMSAFPASGNVIGVGPNAINPLTGSGASVGIAATCSPVTEIYGSAGTTDDYIFLSVTNDGNQTGTSCAGAGSAGACVYSFLVSTNGTSTTTPTAATAGLAAAGGSSAIIIDNTSSTTGASQIYFSSLSNETCAGNGTTGSGTGGCAVQASQSALH